MTSHSHSLATERRARRLAPLVLALAIIPPLAGADVPTDAAPASAAWPQWGGPSRDFTVHSEPLAQRWPADGPPRLWSRALGEGYSAIVADGQRLYTMYWQDGEEYVVALRADTGATVWEHHYAVTPHPDQTLEYGHGPNATPLLWDGKVFTLGFTGLLHCLDSTSGRLLWQRDLVKDFAARPQYYGFSNSLLAYDGHIITLVGGPECGVAALNPADGAVVWKTKTYEISHAAPIVINVDGQDQIVFFTVDEVVGIDAHGGAHLWSSRVVDFCKTNCSAAVWGPDNLLWAATKGVGGARVLKLSRDGDQTKAEVVWIDRKLRMYHWNAVRVGDFLYTSIGDSRTSLATINVKTGEVVERLSGYDLTNGVFADGKLILLDGAGQLLLTRPSAKGLEIVSSAQILDSRTWTVPTLVGTRLYVRDRKTIMALDLH